MRSILLILAIMLLAACSATDVPFTAAKLGKPASFADMEASLSKPGPIALTKYVNADWAINLEGLVNLEHPEAVKAGLEDRMEPIQIYTFALVHPEHGVYLVDSGISEAFLDVDNHPGVSSLVKSGMNLEGLKIHKTTKQIAAEQGGIKGVFLSHIHMDHIMGLDDLEGVDVYIGPGDARMSGPLNFLTKGTSNALLQNVAVLNEWQYQGDGVIDVFGDGSVWAVHSPGHTPGATAYIANTLEGPVLMLGDVTHTKWGWEHGVEPGSFSADIPQSAASLDRLVELAERNSNLAVHPGHQSLD